MSKELMDIVLPRLAQRLNRHLRRYRAGELDDNQFAHKFELLLQQQYAWLAKRGVSEPEAAVLLGHDNARPAQLRELMPLGIGEAARVDGQFTHRLRAVARGEQLAGGALDRALVVGELEVHDWISAQPRQTEYALGHDVLEDLGGAALN